jgi:prepilin-type N-terminal cleavage/methylation domain-containing protein
MTTRTSEGEHAFTLIELLVAMVLVAGLLVIISTLLMRTFGESGRAQQERAAMQSVRDTMSRFGNDLREARSPDRDPTYVGNGNDLGAALLAGSQLQVQLPGQAKQVLDVRDVVEATSRSFAFRADVNAAPGAECVRYAVDSAGGPLVRTVMAFNQALRVCNFSVVYERQVLIQSVR